MHPCPAKPSILARSLEIRRVLQHRIVGVKGPFLTHERTNAFEASPLPENWKIMSWVAIDDLDLAAPQLEGLHTVRLLSRFMPLPSDPDRGNGWMSIPDCFDNAVHTWLMAFEMSRFVKVSPTQGLAETAGAEKRAIRLLNCT